MKKYLIFLSALMFLFPQACPPNDYWKSDDFNRMRIYSSKRLNKINQELTNKLVHIFFSTDKKLQPLKDATHWITEFKARRDELPETLVKLIEDRWLAKRLKKSMAEYISPSGKFRLNFSTTSSDAVPTDDDDNTGVPDYVERAAEYLDHSYDFMVTQEGYSDPILSGQKYDIYFERMSSYGYTVTTSDESTTEIYLHSDFNNFPANTDPDGNQLGALKVTAAHEFKHAIQYKMDPQLYNDFSNFWPETDGTWAEEFVYDQTNDYYNYLDNSSSPLAFPATQMNDVNGTGTYEDVVWQIYLTEKYGNDFMLDVWNRRKNNPNEEFIDTYEIIIANNGGSMVSAIREFALWNYLVGDRYKGNTGYSEGVNYPKSIVETSLPINDTYSRAVSAFAVRQLLIEEIQNQYLTIDVSSSANVQFVVTFTNPQNQTEFINVQTSQYHFQYRLNQISDAALLVINTNTSGSSSNFDIVTSLSSSPSENPENDNIKLTQNPIKNRQLVISHPDLSAGELNSLTVFNLLGKKVMNSRLNVGSDITSINLPSSMAGGIYYAFIRTKSKEKVVKFLFVK